MAISLKHNLKVKNIHPGTFYVNKTHIFYSGYCLGCKTWNRKKLLLSVFTFREELREWEPGVSN